MTFIKFKRFLDVINKNKKRDRLISVNRVIELFIDYFPQKLDI